MHSTIKCSQKADERKTHVPVSHRRLLYVYSTIHFRYVYLKYVGKSNSLPVHLLQLDILSLK